MFTLDKSQLLTATQETLRFLSGRGRDMFKMINLEKSEATHYLNILKDEGYNVAINGPNVLNDPMHEVPSYALVVKVRSGVSNA
jgi:hypothetical protein